MLQIYNNYFNLDPSVLYEPRQNKCYSLILKCGTSSLYNLALLKPDVYKILKFNDIRDSVTEVIVHLREPIQRYYSGIKTQCLIYGINETKLVNILNSTQHMSTVDTHTVPQFWTLLGYKSNKLKFKIHSLDDLNQIDPSIQNLNQNTNYDFEFTDSVKSKINHYMTEDIVLYNQFMNKSTDIESVVQAIKKEKNFINDISQYHCLLDYY